VRLKYDAPAPFHSQQLLSGHQMNDLFSNPNPLELTVSTLLANPSSITSYHTLADIKCRSVEFLQWLRTLISLSSRPGIII
jgi:hypothetical protein